jgi:lipid A 3-O-deacylase PagL
VAGVDAGRGAHALSPDRIPARGVRGALAGLVLAACLLASAAARADDESPLPVWHIGPYLGAAKNSPGGGDWGGVPDRDHLFLGVRGTAPVFRWEALTLAYAAELTPMLIISDNPTYKTGFVTQGGVTRLMEVQDGVAPVYGAGFSPLGLEGQLRVAPHGQVFGAIAMGLIWFTRDVPVANARDVNITAEMGFGLLWEYHERRRMRFGYKYHHLSNSWTAEENPGLNANVFYVGWETAVGGAQR